MPTRGNQRSTNNLGEGSREVAKTGEMGKLGDTDAEVGFHDGSGCCTIAGEHFSSDQGQPLDAFGASKCPLA